MRIQSDLPIGYSSVPDGTIASIVYCLEMTAQPTLQVQPKGRAAPGVIRRWRSPKCDAYRALFQKVGEPYLWASRLMMTNQELEPILADPDVEIYRLWREKTVVGFMELDFRSRGACEITFLGLTPEAVGQGAGRTLIQSAVQAAWARPISRLWLHTCSLDHPKALQFYRKSGFEIYAQLVDIQQDPRVIGILPVDAAPHVPLSI